MKKIFIIFICIISSLVFVQYSQIPLKTVDSISTKNLQVSDKYYLGEKYTEEINKLIDEEYPKVIKEIDGVFVEFENEKDPYEKGHILDCSITDALLMFYIELRKTTNKYKNPPLEPLETDWYGELEEQIAPYLKSNKANISKIDSLLDYADKRQEELEKRRGEIVYP